MRSTRKTKKLFLPAVTAVAAIVGAVESSSGDFVVTLSAPTAFSGYDQYTMSVLNNGANNSGTTIAGADVLITVFTPGKYILVDQTQDLGTGSAYGDGVADVNLTGSINAGSGGGVPGSTGSGYGTTVSSDSFSGASSAKGSFMRTGNGGLAVDFENGVNDRTHSWSSDANHGVVSPVYSSLTTLEIVYASTSGGVSDTKAEKFVNIVVPTGTSFGVAGAVGTAVPTMPNFQTNFVDYNNFNGSITPLVQSTQYPMASNIGGAINEGTQGTPANPQGTYSPSGGKLAVMNQGGDNFTPGFIRNITPSTSAGWTGTLGFAGGDTEIYLLHILNNGASAVSVDSEIAADIQASNPYLTATAAIPAGYANLGGVAWDIEVSFPYDPAGDDLFAFDFTGFTDAGVSNVSVTDIAALPEPATTGLLLVAGLSALARRRRLIRNAVSI